ncbi:MAG: hypothetical protein JW983_09125 [Elusimicrobia bacterium]|nr:hypothetical protein [Elusimicrobiota bacterium]
MKKILAICGIICLMFAASNTLRAVDNGVFNIGVTVIEASGVSIVVLGDTVVLGYVVVGSSDVSTTAERTTTKNIGAVNVTFKLRITSKPTGWTVGTASLNDTDTDKFVLATVFAKYNETPEVGWFSDNDVITETDKTSTQAPSSGAGTFVSDTPTDPAVDGANGADVDGYDADPGFSLLNLFFFNAPTSLSNLDQYAVPQTIQVTITAIEQT